MTTLKFKCKLLSDVILNQKAATEGPNETLDFIPGSCFLGVIASKYSEFGDDAMEVFHSGKVRFGDAHPSKDGFRGLKVPTSMFHPKLKKASEELYIHHATNHDDTKIREKQLKQCRSGYYNFSNSEAKLIKTETNFAIKSAYDREKRRSQDEKMYGYQSLQKGLELYFEIEIDIDNDELVSSIVEALKGIKRVGRSRTAQYGLVEITGFDYKEVESDVASDGYVTVYADSRLIFLDDNGLPTFQPTVEQLGLKGGEICWEKSQIRTFQYAPWNFKRQCFDTDRCGIEKGSVIVVKTDSSPDKSKYVGYYQNEGFGKVIYNPAFLEAKEDGIATYRLMEEKKEKEGSDKVPLSGTNLLNYLAREKRVEDITKEVYEMVNFWADKNEKIFKGDLFASQWGKIRSIAMKYKTKKELTNELFDKTKDKDGKEIPDAYLSHGVAADKWSERGRKKEFEEFVEALNDDNAQIAIINLAAEMAKRCRREK